MECVYLANNTNDPSRIPDAQFPSSQTLFADHYFANEYNKHLVKKDEVSPSQCMPKWPKFLRKANTYNVDLSYIRNYDSYNVYQTVFENDRHRPIDAPVQYFSINTKVQNNLGQMCLPPPFDVPGNWCPGQLHFPTRLSGKDWCVTNVVSVPFPKKSFLHRQEQSIHMYVTPAPGCKLVLIGMCDDPTNPTLVWTQWQAYPLSVFEGHNRATLEEIFGTTSHTYHKLQ